jgi:hypothetical protein
MSIRVMALEKLAQLEASEAENVPYLQAEVRAAQKRRARIEATRAELGTISGDEYATALDSALGSLLPSVQTRIRAALSQFSPERDAAWLGPMSNQATRSEASGQTPPVSQNLQR